MGLFDNVLEEASTKEKTKKLAVLTLEKVLESRIEELNEALTSYTVDLKEGYEQIEGKYRKVILEFTIGKTSPFHRPSYKTYFFDTSDGLYVSFSYERGGYIKRYYVTSGATEEELTTLFEEMLVEIVGHIVGVNKIQSY